MEKRVIIAFVMSFVVLYAFRALYMPPKPAEPAEQQQSTESQAAPAPAPTPVQPAPPEVAQSTKHEAPVPNTPRDLRGEKPENFTIDTPLYSATISNVGGVLRNFFLKTYKDGEGHPLQLINQMAGDRVGFPLAITTGDKTIDDELARAVFSGHQEDDTLRLEYAANGLYARKDLVFDQDNYIFSLQTTVTKDGKALPHSVVSGRFRRSVDSPGCDPEERSVPIGRFF